MYDLKKPQSQHVGFICFVQIGDKGLDHTLCIAQRSEGAKKWPRFRKNYCMPRVKHLYLDLKIWFKIEVGISNNCGSVILCVSFTIALKHCEQKCNNILV